MVNGLSRRKSGRGNKTMRIKNFVIGWWGYWVGFMWDSGKGLKRALDRVARGEPFSYRAAHKKHIRKHDGRFLLKGAECGEFCHCETCILGLGK